MLLPGPVGPWGPGSPGIPRGPWVPLWPGGPIGGAILLMFITWKQVKTRVIRTIQVSWVFRAHFLIILWADHEHVVIQITENISKNPNFSLPEKGVEFRTAKEITIRYFVAVSPRPGGIFKTYLELSLESSFRKPIKVQLIYKLYGSEVAVTIVQVQTTPISCRETSQDLHTNKLSCECLMRLTAHITFSLTSLISLWLEFTFCHNSNKSSRFNEVELRAIIAFSCARRVWNKNDP